jgi:hypothetical protein
MPNIAIARPKWSDDDVHRALERELRSGIQLKEAIEEQRVVAAAEEAKQYKRGKTTPLGKHVAEIPAWEFFNMVRKYGHDEVHSRNFMKYFQKKFPHLSTSRI